MQYLAITMKNTVILGFIMLASLSLQAQKKQSSTTRLNNATDSLSYALGMDLGDNMKNNGLEKINLQMMVQGIQDQFAQTTILPLPFAREYVMQEMTRLAAIKAEASKTEGQKFLIDNGKKPGVITTPSGLQYKVIQSANGPKPKASDVVEVHYKGTLINGTVFDSSIERGEKAQFPLDQVIPGWTEGVQLMPVGSKYQFFIPAELAYGDQDMGVIPPNSTLIFEVELFAIKTGQ